MRIKWPVTYALENLWFCQDIGCTLGLIEAVRETIDTYLQLAGLHPDAITG